MKYFIIIMCLILMGCEESISSDKLTKMNKDGSLEVYEQKIIHETQIIETVSSKNIITWISNHTNIHIDTMALVTQGNGYNAGYIVVYHVLKGK